MINAGEDLLICDLAETYGVLDYKALRPTLAAALASGLRENSRIKMKMAGQRQPLETVLMAIIADHLAMLCWMNTEDGAKGKNRPKSVLQILMTEPEEEPVAFDSAEAFKRRRKEILERWQKDGN